MRSWDMRPLSVKLFESVEVPHGPVKIILKIGGMKTCLNQKLLIVGFKCLF